MYLYYFFDIRVDQLMVLTISTIDSPSTYYQLAFYGFGYDTDLNH